jgi:hypothetical protein
VTHLPAKGNDITRLRNEQLNQEDGGGEEADQTTPPTLEPRKRAPPTCSEQMFKSSADKVDTHNISQIPTKAVRARVCSIPRSANKPYNLSGHSVEHFIFN